MIGLFLAVLLIGIGYREFKKIQERKKLIDLPQIHVQGELRALTLYSPTSYFIYRDKEMGYEYELCSMLANDLGLHLKMIVAPNPVTMMRMLEHGEGDMIAYNMPITNENNSRFQYCGREFLTHQVLVQQKKQPIDMVRSVTGLIGKTVVVHKNSRYLTRLESLNQELGGGIKIQAIPHDSFTVEDLIGQVATGQIEYTVANNNIAQFNSTFYKNINTSLAISFSQRSSWMVRKTSPKLGSAIDRWFRENMYTDKYQEVTQRYFSSGKNTSTLVSTALFPGKKGQLSIYDGLFKKYGAEIGWDWRMLASIAYQESNFDASAINWTGASGLMQIMPKTARAVGVSRDSLFIPNYNVLAAARLLKIYERNFAIISNNEQRIKMTLAAYNCGLGHVTDARALTRKHGLNPFKWEDNVRTFILLKSQPKYYEDRVCKSGYLRGTETVAFVSEVWKRYNEYLRMVPEKSIPKKARKH
ncbi:MAG TPA: transporter substrate-binding domain-containing protein [Bacteroidales bacterium]|nr:transporter substrate-binding domain-containing protein [Bacteroidales bacterium]